ncbi:TolC family protein [Halobacteriovorax sp. HLS]|uniref:TolC family protein n=1 Tax=Halobacteriovorax sp. HLS TaxID=2234000 RepID=UPI000FD87789|nr:TolC family protein [Halobacteriovorax sp. HLS]
MKKAHLAILLMCTTSPLLASTEVILTEKLLKEKVDSSAPNTLAIEASFLAVDLTRQSFEDNFDLRLDGNASYAKTNENSFSAQMPVTSPTKYYKLGLTKPLDSGISLGVNTFSEQITNSQVYNGTKTGVGFEVSVDLYKNFLGRLTKSQRDVFEEAAKRAGSERDIQKKSFHQNVRKIYWSLVANQEQINISNQLEKFAQTQLDDSKKRFKNNIADSGEVARYESQLADRKANIITLKYQREVYLQQIKELIPELSNKQLKLGTYNIKEAANQIFACTALISKFQEPPMQYTNYDEILANLRNEYDGQRKLTNSYSDMNIQFNSQLQRLGKTSGYGNSWSEFTDDGKNAFSAGVVLNIPLGESNKKSMELKKLLEKKRYLSQKEELVGRVNAYHNQIIKNILLLQEVMKQQQINSSKLELSFRESQKKYNQARLTVRELIQDQNQYFSSNLLEIKSQLQIMTTLLDYFSVYTEIPCELNI